MLTPPVRVERRVGQRFPFLLPVALRQVSTGIENAGFTQDLSSRGVFFFTDAVLEPGAEIELILSMPSQITLAESMRVKCRARVLRVLRPAQNVISKTAGAGEGLACAETKVGVAVRLESYEYLPEAVEVSASFERVAVLHERHEDELALSARPSVSSHAGEKPTQPGP
jgi:hypothetical protein